MNSRTTRRFRNAFTRLPNEVQEQARRTFAVWKTDPHHSSLRFKQIHSSQPIFSVRVSRDWRALGLKQGETVVWFWIGSHSDYHEMIAHL